MPGEHLHLAGKKHTLNQLGTAPRIFLCCIERETRTEKNFTTKLRSAIAWTPASVNNAAMRMSRQEFLDWPNKAITLIGMSGVGKTMLASKLPQTSWFHYSGDYRIGTRYLNEAILDNIKRQAMEVEFLRDLLRSDSIYIANNITVDNLEPISTYLGKVGAADKGGLPLDEFRHRQRMHREAENRAMIDVEQFIEKAHDIYGYKHFVNDSGGSLCELNSKEPLEVLAKNTVLFYLRADDETEQKIIQRSLSAPKPMYYQEAFLETKLAEYMSEKSYEDTDEIVPDEFSQWIFPELVVHRRPLYQGIADNYGYTLDAKNAEGITTEQELLELLADVIAAGP